MSADSFSQLALQALKADQPERAIAYFEEALEHAERPRPDLLHSMGVVLLQLAEPEKARPLMAMALEQAWAVGAEQELLLQCALGLAAASEDSDLVAEALAAYEQAFEVVDDNEILQRMNLQQTLNQEELKEVIAPHLRPFLPAGIISEKATEEPQV